MQQHLTYIDANTHTSSLQKEYDDAIIEAFLANAKLHDIKKKIDRSGLKLRNGQVSKSCYSTAL